MDLPFGMAAGAIGVELSCADSVQDCFAMMERAELAVQRKSTLNGLSVMATPQLAEQPQAAVGFAVSGAQQDFSCATRAARSPDPSP